MTTKPVLPSSYQRSSWRKGKYLPERFKLVTLVDSQMLRMQDQRGEMMSVFEQTMKRLTPGWYSIHVSQLTKVTKECWSSAETQMFCFFWFISCQRKQLEVRMISGTAKKRKCYPMHAVSERLAKPVVYNLLSFHALTGCDSTSSFSGHGKKKCWKIFQNQPLDVNGIGRDGDQAPTVCRSPVWHTCTANRRTCQASPLRKGRQGSGDVAANQRCLGTPCCASKPPG